MAKRKNRREESRKEKKRIKGREEGDFQLQQQQMPAAPEKKVEKVEETKRTRYDTIEGNLVVNSFLQKGGDC